MFTEKSPNLLLPEDFDAKRLIPMKNLLYEEAIGRHGKGIQRCGSEKTFDTCFSGFIYGKKLILLFYYNIGKNTYCTRGEFDLYQDEEE